MTPRQRQALGHLLGARTPLEWDMRVQRLDRALVEGAELRITKAEYDALLAPLVRLRLRRALMHAMEDGVISQTAASQLLGYAAHGRGGFLEDLLDAARFPNLDSTDFAFLRQIKGRLHEDVKRVQAAARAAGAGT